MGSKRICWEDNGDTFAPGGANQQVRVGALRSYWFVVLLERNYKINLWLQAAAAQMTVNCAADYSSVSHTVSQHVRVRTRCM